VRVATGHEFPDLTVLRSWLAPTIAQNANHPAAVRVQIVHTTLGSFFTASQASRSPMRDPTPVYAVQLTGATFVCPCGAPEKLTGPALQLAWNPAIHYPSTVNAGRPLDLRALGITYTLDVGKPTQPAPSGPVCGQPNGPATTITSVTRLDHNVLALPEVFTSPGGRTPAKSATDALRDVMSGALAPKVKATLALMTGPPNAIVPGSHLVWVFSVPSIVQSPSEGLPGCGPAAAVIDATTGENLEWLGGTRF
jgi:hypothetical protein